MLLNDLTRDIWQNPFQTQDERDRLLLANLDTSDPGAVEVCLDIIHCDLTGRIGVRQDGTLWTVAQKARWN